MLGMLVLGVNKCVSRSVLGYVSVRDDVCYTIDSLGYLIPNSKIFHNWLDHACKKNKPYERKCFPESSEH